MFYRKEKRWFIFVLTAISGGVTVLEANTFPPQAVSVAVITSAAAAVIVFLIVLALASVRLLVSLTAHGRVLGSITALLPCTFALAFARETSLPLAVVVLADFLQELLHRSRDGLGRENRPHDARDVLGTNDARGTVPILLLILTAVLTAVLHAPLVMILIAFAFAGVCLYAFDLLDRLQKDFKILVERGERIAELERRLGGQRRAAQSLEYTAKIAERGRLAMRLHDEVGHGISGSILLLEGAAAVMDKDASTAKDTIVRAAENLRTSADEIRRVLREEYADRADAGLSRLKNELARFGAEHPHIQTEWTAYPGAEELPPYLWACLCENMTEALTNTLRHSNANLFRVDISNKNKLLRVEFSDNGGRPRVKTDDRTRKSGSMSTNVSREEGGIGLAGIEERCALCYGRCFYEKREDGFHIIMTFPLRQRMAL